MECPTPRDVDLEALFEKHKTEVGKFGDLLLFDVCISVIFIIFTERRDRCSSCGFIMCFQSEFMESVKKGIAKKLHNKIAGADFGQPWRRMGG